MIRQLVLLLSSLLLTGACAPGGRGAAEAIVPFMTAVQEQDFDRLYCLSGGAADAEELGATDVERRENFRAWARSHIEAYLDGRDAGWVEPDEHGIGLVKIFALGKGTYYTLGAPRPLGEDAVQVRADLRFGYGKLDLSRLSPGTTFYLCGAPVGKIHSIRVPAGSAEIRVEVLESVAVDWTLIRSASTESCPGGWAVASAAPVAGSESTATMTWTF